MLVPSGRAAAVLPLPIRAVRRPFGAAPAASACFAGAGLRLQIFGQARRGLAFSARRSCAMESGLVSCEWLKAELDAPSGPLKIVEATWYLPNSPFAAPEGSSPQAEYTKGPRLPGAQFFDIDGVAADSSLPHMLPDEERFSAAMAALGIEPGTRVVAYDRLGLFSSPRFWYTLKVAFGHPAPVAVLDGGLPRWKELGFPLEEAAPNMPPPAKPARWSKVASAVWDKSQVLENVSSASALHLDARPKPRFDGLAPEPRPKMRSGHAPNSRSLPATQLLNGSSMLPPEELLKVVQAAGIKPEQLRDRSGPDLLRLRAHSLHRGPGAAPCWHAAFVLGRVRWQLGRVGRLPGHSDCQARGRRW
ncbi:unnamed protein product [Effrenium voratum]|uniref:Rhodanese domain-containing protein n=1 Tax=Effrenium voratum TaxID=2562239 RepID=A0AA36JCA0_9DINO|nr:unnamed protein product [Effrenium voratum]